ncbi:universal stress protein [Amycolatopsis sp. NPDC004368]
MNTANQGDVVVGVDGSEVSLAALRWALSEARASGRTVVAVRAWTFDPFADFASAAVRSPVELAALQRRELESEVADALAEVGETQVRVEAIDGAAGPVLVRLAEDAAMLVVGSHGHGRLLRLLVGSVSAYCLREAHCPVVILPAGTVEKPEAALEAETAGNYYPGPLL